MGMSSGGSTGFNSEINVTPMVDIMLVLMIIFMVITPLLQQGVTVTLPKNMNSPEEDPAIIKDTSVVLAITADNKFYLGKEPIEPEAITEEVDKKLKDKAQEDKIVYIRSDVNADYGTVVNLIDTIRKSGIDQIGLVADKKKGKGGEAAPAAS